MGTAMSLIRSFALGAGAMYFMDPRSGRRRRAMIRDKADMVVHDLNDVMGKAGRDLQNRAQGLAANARSLVSGDDVTDDVLVQRIRSQMGRVVSHPRAVEVSADQGRVVLSGPILAHEVDDLMDTVYMVKGVSWVDNQLAVHDRPGNVPGLQGVPRRATSRFELAQHNWSPAPRVLAGLIGSLLVLRGGTERSLLSLLLGGAGLVVLLRAVANKPLSILAGGGSRCDGIDVQKTITIDAPVAEVFGFLQDPVNYPRIMEHALEVQALPDDRFRWTVSGPAGAPVVFETEITAMQDNDTIAWKSVPGSMVDQCGTIRLEEENGGTRVNVQMTYAPPAGIVGHAVASLFGQDPKQGMDDGLLRLKSLLEEGKTTAHGRTVTREEIGQ